jgi:hypothetical protein
MVWIISENVGEAATGSECKDLQTIDTQKSQRVRVTLFMFRVFVTWSIHSVETTQVSETTRNTIRREGHSSLEQAPDTKNDTIKRSVLFFNFFPGISIVVRSHVS